jgi:hypothetical protein
MWGHYGSKIMGVFLKPFNEALGLTTNILWWYKPSIYGGLCPIYFFRELGFGGSTFVLYFSYFDRPILEEYVSQIEAHLFHFCLRVAQDGLPSTTKDMHLSFENMAVTNALCLQTSLMDFHHDTSFRYILKDDSISLASKICIHSCSGKGVCRNPTLAKCGGEAQHFQSWGFGVLRDSRMFRVRQQGPKHLALRCSWCHWKGLEA